MALGAGSDNATMQFLKKTFARRDELAKIKSGGMGIGGLFSAMSPPNSSRTDPRRFSAWWANRIRLRRRVTYRYVLSPRRFRCVRRRFDEYSPYLTSTARSKLAQTRKHLVSNLVEVTARGFLSLDRLAGEGYLGPRYPTLWTERFGVTPTLDPRWLDAAIQGHDATHLASPSWKRCFVPDTSRSKISFGGSSTGCCVKGTMSFV